MNESFPSPGGKSFEGMKMVNEHGAEYWSARDLQPLLGYDQRRNFDGAVKMAKTSCEQSGTDCDNPLCWRQQKGRTRESVRWSASGRRRENRRSFP